MEIGKVSLSGESESRVLSAQVDGFDLWFRFPRKFELSDSADPFLAVALIPAMRAGETLTVHPSNCVSPRLLAATDEIQNILHCWYPHLSRIQIDARAAVQPVVNPGVGSFFSGGVD